MHVSKIENLQAAENREDGSDFDEIQTKKIAATQAVWWKILDRTKRTKSSRKIIENIFENIFEKFSK